MLSSFIISTVLISILAILFLDSDLVIRAQGQNNGHLGIKAGNKLYRELQGLNRFCLAGGKAFELTRYKFFTDVLDELLIAYRSCGADIFGHVLEVRQNLLRDLKSERALGSIRRGSFLEMALISALGVCFALFAIGYAQIPLSVGSITLVLCWQALGAGAFVWLGGRYYRRVFSAFQAYVKRANLLDVYVKTGRPINMIAKELALDSLPGDATLAHLRERMENIVRLLKERGGCDPAQTKELGMECWFCHEQKLEEYTQGLKRLKLLVITVFFLSGYLFLFFSMVGSLHSMP